MNPTIIGLLASGVAVGLGATVLIGLAVPERPDLLAALNPAGRTQSRNPSDTDDDGTLLGPWQRRIETALAATRLATPDADLRVIGMTRGEYLLTRIALSLVALLVAPLYVLIFAAFHLTIPAVIPAGAGVLLAALVWVAVAGNIETKAENARRDMRHALVSYLQLVALHRAAGLGIGAAMDQAGAASSTWAFRRITVATNSATRAGHQHWHGIATLADELGIDELSDLSAIAHSSGAHGATIYTTLMTRATSLRDQLQADDLAAAQVASGRMSIPKALLSMATMAFLIYPAITTLMST